VLHRLAAFAGRFTLEDAVAVAGDVRDVDVVACLVDLVSKSFMMIDVRAKTAFYRLYETMREHALQKALDAGELPQVRRRHAEYMTSTLLRISEPKAAALVTTDISWAAAGSVTFKMNTTPLPFGCEYH